jgi:hypothetical protein
MGESARTRYSRILPLTRHSETVLDGLSGLARSHVCPCDCRTLAIAADRTSAKGASLTGIRAATAEARRRTSHATPWTQPLSTPGGAVAPSKTAIQAGPQTT